MRGALSNTSVGTVVGMGVDVYVVSVFVDVVTVDVELVVLVQFSGHVVDVVVVEEIVVVEGLGRVFLLHEGLCVLQLLVGARCFICHCMMAGPSTSSRADQHDRDKAWSTFNCVFLSLNAGTLPFLDGKQVALLHAEHVRRGSRPARVLFRTQDGRTITTIVRAVFHGKSLFYRR